MPGKKNSTQTDQDQLKHKAQVKEAPVQEAQVKGAPAQEAQVKEAPAQEAPVQEVQAQKSPVQEILVQDDHQPQKRTLRSLVNTPLKRVMFGIQILSYVLIMGSPAIGGLIGKMLELKTGATAGVILGVFIAGEVLFYGSLAFLGKELLLLIKDRVSGVFKRKA